MSAFNITNEVTINHRELGRQVWEWSDEDQAKFLTGFAEVFKAETGVGLLQIHFIAEHLRKTPDASTPSAGSPTDLPNT
jgi:hypothetical protein